MYYVLLTTYYVLLTTYYLPLYYLHHVTLAQQLVEEFHYGPLLLTTRYLLGDASEAAGRGVPLRSQAGAEPCRWGSTAGSQ